MHPTADRFDRALQELLHESSDADLVPVRVARACADALPVDGAGLSLHAGALRVPIGASGSVTAHAERLQFTFGDGPCLRAHDDGRTIAFEPHEIERNWPGLYAALVSDTPFSGVLSLPLPEPLGPTVVLDLWVNDPETLARLDREEVVAVLDRVTATLANDLREAGRIPAEEIPWLDGPDALLRSSTWQAVGQIGMALLIDPPDALEVLRAAAVTSGRSVDEVAADLLTGRLRLLDLAAAPRPEVDG